MKRFTVIAALCASLASATALAAPAQMRSILAGGLDNDPAVALWIKRLSPQDPYALFYQTYRIGAQNVTLMSGDARDCSTMDEGFRKCPLYLVVQDEKGTVLQQVGEACLPDMRSPAFSTSQRITTELDKDEHLIKVSSPLDGKPLEGCSSSIDIHGLH